MGTPYAVSSDLVSAYPAKSLAIAQYIDAYKLDTGPVQNVQTGTSFTFALTDTTKIVTANNAAASAYTVPPQSSVVWEAYTVLRLLNLGAGVVTLTAGAGVTITGTLTVAQYSSATLVRTASNTWTVAGSGASAGMDLITPTSVAGSGVTLSGGAISFSASTTVSVNGCFSANYLNYLVVLSSTHLANVPIRFRMRLAGTDASGATDYRTGWIISTSGAAIDGSTAASNGAASGYIMQHSFDGNTVANSTFGSPFVAAPTNVVSSVIASSLSRTDGGSTYSQHILGTSYDGLTILPASGSITGTLRIYGLRNA